MTEQSKKDLERFTKFFTLKCVNVIIQSRLGQKVKFESKPISSGNDWFNLTIEDNPEINKLTKSRISSPLPTTPVNIEISLKTPDFSSLVLEIWSLSFDPEETDNVRILYTVYNRMNLLLKSLISVTRVTPAYKLSRLKSDYTICYNVWEGDVDWTKQLGEEFRSGQLGRVGTPFGTLVFKFGWRLKMTVQSVFRPMYLTEDHFNAETDEVKPKIGAFSDHQEPPCDDLSDIPFSKLLKQSQIQNLKKEEEPPQDDRIIEVEPTYIKEDDFIHINLNAPFANDNPNSDPVAFFHECQQAPNLTSLPTQEEKEITQQLDQFENSVFVFDDFVKSLCGD